MARFETEVLPQHDNLAALAKLAEAAVKWIAARLHLGT
jgi:hypothetical protein